MKTDIKLSTRFTQAQGTHQVGLLVAVGADQPPSRPPINVSLVLDRSGSMAGEPLAAAIEAACRFAGFLSSNDRMSVVAFDNEVTTLVAGVPGGDPAVAEAIRRLAPGGQTNLSGGWLKGQELAAAARVAGVNRVVLFTDGQANIGLTQPSRMAALAGGAVQDGVGTSCFGFGPAFNLELLQGMATAGRGNFWYIETLDQMGPVFDEEIEGLVALAAQNLELELRLVHPGVSGVTLLQNLPLTRTPDGRYHILLGDVYATAPRLLGLRIHVEHPEALGAATLAEVTLKADAVRPEGIERLTMTLPVVANLDGADHVEPVVERTLLRFEAAQARAEAVKKADAGDFDGAKLTLYSAADHLLPHVAEDAALADEVDDLRAEAQRMDAQHYDAADRHYHHARSRGVLDQKAAYLAKIRRHR